MQLVSLFKESKPFQFRKKAGMYAIFLTEEAAHKLIRVMRSEASDGFSFDEPSQVNFLAFYMEYEERKTMDRKELSELLGKLRDGVERGAIDFKGAE